MIDSSGDRERPTTVMVAEDEPTIRKLLTEHLSELGFQIHAFGDGRAALNYALEHPPDLAILDVMMPLKNGWEVARELRQAPSTEAIKILMLTAVESEISKNVAPTFGADDTMSKPFVLDELVERIHSLLAKS